MRILFDCPIPFSLAHGGLQVQIVRTRDALQKLGVEVEFLRWDDTAQTGDIIHHFGRAIVPLVQLAQQKGIKVVMAELLTEQGSRSRAALEMQGLAFSLARSVLPPFLTRPFNWESYRLADASIALTSWEAELMTRLFDAPPEKVHVVPNGVEDLFFQSPKSPRGQWLVCTATITERKRVLELAEAALAAKTHLWIIGKPYSDTDPYAQRFFTLVRANPQTLRYEGAVSDRAQLARIYREARGFVLLSAMESLSLSALEAAACECPLLLSDLPWARTAFKGDARYCPITSPAQMAGRLRQFYDDAPTLKAPPKPATWTTVAAQLKAIYESLLKTSR